MCTTWVPRSICVVFSRAGQVNAYSRVVLASCTFWESPVVDVH